MVFGNIHSKQQEFFFPKISRILETDGDQSIWNCAVQIYMRSKLPVLLPGKCTAAGIPVEDISVIFII